MVRGSERHCLGDRLDTRQVFEFVKAHQEQYPITTMCRVLEVSTSGYYAWLKRPLSRRAQEDEALMGQIKKIHTRSKGTYGAPRIHAKLAQEGVHVGRKRVARLMQKAGRPVYNVCMVPFTQTSTRYLQK